MNGLFVALSHQINPLSCITCNARTRAHTWHGSTTGERCQLASKVFFFLFLKVFWTTSQCASALLLSYSCKASFSTWGYFCSIMYGGGIKTVDAMASPFQCHVQAPGGKWHARVAHNRAPRLATHTSRGVGSMCEEHGIKRRTSVATGLWRPGTMVAPGQPQSPGPCRKG